MCHTLYVVPRHRRYTGRLESISRGCRGEEGLALLEVSGAQLSFVALLTEPLR